MVLPYLCLVVYGGASPSRRLPSIAHLYSAVINATRFTRMATIAATRCSRSVMSIVAWQSAPLHIDEVIMDLKATERFHLVQFATEDHERPPWTLGQR